MLSPPERKMRVLDTVVEPLTRVLPVCDANDLHGRAMQTRKRIEIQAL
jgi:hypothetical protein